MATRKLLAIIAPLRSAVFVLSLFCLSVCLTACRPARAQTSPLSTDSLYFVTPFSWTHHAVWTFPTLTNNYTWLFPDGNGSGTGFFTNNGTGTLSWTALSTLDARYIDNGTSLQASANFNISGDGNLGGVLDVAGTIQSNSITANIGTGFGLIGTNNSGVISIQSSSPGYIPIGLGANPNFVLGLPTSSNGSIAVTPGIGTLDLAMASGDSIGQNSYLLNNPSHWPQTADGGITGSFSCGGNDTVHGELFADYDLHSTPGLLIGSPSGGWSNLECSEIDLHFDGISFFNSAGTPQSVTISGYGGSHNRTLTLQDHDGAIATTDVPGGGTGSSSFTAHGPLLGEGTSAVAQTAAGTSGMVFTSAGSSDGSYSFQPSAFAWADVTVGAWPPGTVTVNASYNVTSVISTGAGVTTIALTNALPTTSANPCVIVTPHTGGGPIWFSATAAGLTISVWGGNPPALTSLAYGYSVEILGY